MLTLRYAFRQLLKSPGFTLVAVLILALGIGMSTSAFSVTNVLLLRTMPYPQGDQLMRIFRTGNEGLRSRIRLETSWTCVRVRPRLAAWQRTFSIRSTSRKTENRRARSR